MEPDILPAPMGPKTSPSDTSKLTPARKPAIAKLNTLETILSISQPSLSLSAHVSKTEGMLVQTPSLKQYKSNTGSEQYEHYISIFKDSSKSLQ